MGCTREITSGITFSCSDIFDPIGVDKDLILVNYDEFDYDGTVDVSNREADDTNNNQGGLTSIKLKTGATQHVFEGTDYSVIPTVTGEVNEDGNTWYLHSIAFTVYNKDAESRKTLENLGGSRVVAIAVDRSTGLYEIFGIRHGLKVSAMERVYTGAQKSNAYGVTIATPEIAVLREPTVGELAVDIVTAV